MFTVFPENTQGIHGTHYFKVQFPVGFLGAVFDSLSFFITIFIVRRALRATSGASYVAHLSVDFLIAIVATWWILFVFTFSGWLISQFDARPEQALLYRSQIYEDRALEAVRNPAANWRNIYFGFVMGASAMIPTTIHIGLSFKAYVEVFLLTIGRRDEPVDAPEG